MSWATSLLGSGGTTAATTAGTTAATTAGAAASAAPAVSGSTGLMGSLNSALGSNTGQLIQKLTGPGQQASAQAAAAGQAESQKGMQFANAGSGQPQLQQFATQTTPISSGTYDPISQLERFRMYQGR